MSCQTWLDLQSEAIVPPYGARQGGTLGPVALMVSTGPDFKFITATSGPGTQEPFFHSTLFNLNGNYQGLAVAGPFIGAPYGVMILESLIALGVEKIIVFGWCGAISSLLNIGDILIPDCAMADEGTSCNYIESHDRFPISNPSVNLNQIISREMATAGIEFKTGKIWTTDAIYRETEKKVAYFKDQGAVAVEMECSALFSAANFRKKEIAAVLVVSDHVSSDSWKPGFKNPEFKAGRKAGVQVVLNACKSLLKNIHHESKH